MFDIADIDLALPPIATGNGITIGTLLAACDARPGAPLVFSCQGRPFKPGYHVTEVRASKVAALDFDGNPEAWSEIVIQLWDVMDGDRTHMLAGKFAAIIRKVSDHAGLDQSARLTFEVSDGIAPIQLYCAGFPEEIEGVLQASLTPRAASFKPRERWLEEEKQACSCCDATSRRFACR